jgi:hypothetical protein
MYAPVVRQLAKTLGNLDAILGKAVAHAEARKFPVDNFCAIRLAPDMLPFSRQIQLACDLVKNVTAAIAGREPPRFEDTETTIVELRARIAKTLEYVNSFSAQDLEVATPTTAFKLPNPPGKVMFAEASIYSRTLPNFFFHVTMAYAILRAGGVEIGKMDFLGQLDVRDA